MQPTTVRQDADTPSNSIDARLCELRHRIEHAAHRLPTQGPITVFVHHNTLHTYEDVNFESGVEAGGRLYGCHAFLPEKTYREKLQSGRIRVQDLQNVLQEDLGDTASSLVANLGTRYALRLAMLEYSLCVPSPNELRWVIAETDALRKFRSDVGPATRERMIAETRRWAQRDLCSNNAFASDSPAKQVVDEVLEQFDRQAIDSWSDETWEAFVLSFLWRSCMHGVSQVELNGKPQRQPKANDATRRHRDLLLDTTGEDTDRMVDEILIPFTSAFLDQGFADWQLPNRSEGFYRAFLLLYGQSFAATTSLQAELRREAVRLQRDDIGPLASIAESLQLLGVSEEEEEQFLLHSLLALRGWAGMVWQLETNAEWTPKPAPEGSLVEFLAVRLLLDRLTVKQVAREALRYRGDLSELRTFAAERVAKEQPNEAAQRGVREQTAFVISQLAQVRGWNPEQLLQLCTEQWTALVKEIESFNSLQRRRIYHLAYEAKYRTETLDAVLTHCQRVKKITIPGEVSPVFQVVTCIDDREESFRRHLEEVDPECETFGVAGFYGVAMYYRGAAEAHFRPLCPINIKPNHFVIEQPSFSAKEAGLRRASARRRLGRASHHTHRGSRSFVGGMLTGVFGSLAAFPLVARVLFPRTTAQITKLFGSIVHTPNTELQLERLDPDPGPDGGHVGYTVEEMAAIVAGGLRSIGMADTSHLSRMMIVLGHGSGSLNNPHESAYNCGACSGGRGGANARAFARMANDPRVRQLLEGMNLAIPDDCWFVGGYHNTCDDSVAFYDLDNIPLRHRELFERARISMDEARRRDAHERCRRFESASLNLTFEEALRHVEERSEDLSQARPEYNHATNALCFVGRRSWSRGLFLDRRAFLTSYDPHQDDERSSILEGMLRAVIPVCAGISLEYYFSTVDVEGYGCGSKLPHNITSLIGVMTGASSDLRPGLSAQMVEIHEPLRILFVIETSAKAMHRIIAENPPIQRLVEGRWVQLAILDADTGTMQRYVDGEFVPYEQQQSELPCVSSSHEWYRNQRDHLGFASILSHADFASLGLTAPQSPAVQ